MTLLNQLQAHKGGLIRLRDQLWWYGGRGWCGNSGRLCLVLDAVSTDEEATARATAATASVATNSRLRRIADAALLLVDGAPHWVCVEEADIELLDGGDQ